MNLTMVRGGSLCLICFADNDFEPPDDDDDDSDNGCDANANGEAPVEENDKLLASCFDMIWYDTMTW